MGWKPQFRSGLGKKIRSHTRNCASTSRLLEKRINACCAVEEHAVPWKSGPLGPRKAPRISAGFSPSGRSLRKIHSLTVTSDLAPAIPFRDHGRSQDGTETQRLPPQAASQQASDRFFEIKDGPPIRRNQRRRRIGGSSTDSASCGVVTPQVISFEDFARKHSLSIF
jgi:hypothetical protein